MPERHSRPRTRTKLLGFGPWGWGLLVVFCALLAWAWTTPDPRYQIFVWIYESFGIETLYWFVIWIVISNVLLLQYYVFNPIFAATLAIAAFVSSRFASAWRIAACFAFAFFAPHVFRPAIKFAERYMNDWAGMEIVRLLNPLNHMAVVGTIATNLVASVLLGIVFRSWLVALALLAMIPLAVFDRHLFTGNLISIRTAPGELFAITANVALAHALFATITLTWAVRMRRRVPAFESGCPVCGYDTRDLPSVICPECGHRLDRQQPPAAPQAPPTHDPAP